MATRFYVTVQDAGRVGFLMGPYDTHEEALVRVREAREKAYKADPRSHFYAFGTASTARDIKTVFGKGKALCVEVIER